MAALAHVMKAHRIFFPLAAAHGAVSVLLWLVIFSGPWQSTLRFTPWIHGHEMVFGFAMAVISGYLLTRVGGLTIAGMAVVWLAGRWTAVHAAVPPAFDATVQIIYPLLIAWLVGLPFLRAAKSLRNAATPVVLIAFAAAQFFYQTARLGYLSDGGINGLYLAINLITALLFLMGGRVIAGAASGAIRRGGEQPPPVAQPRAERIGLIALIVLLISDLAAISWLGGVAALSAGVVTVIRLVGWQFFKTWRDAPLSFLQIGYLWLAIGLVARGVKALSAGVTPVPGVGVHLIAIGGLGTLALAMMIRTTQQRERWPLELNIFAKTGLIFISAAALARAGSYYAQGTDMLWAAAFLWALGMINYFFAALPPPIPR